MTKLSVNINKIATLRNARGGAVPDVIKAAIDIERFGAEGITVHPRPDERHIRRSDVISLKPALRTEVNIEGFPSPDFLQLIREVRPPFDPEKITAEFCQVLNSYRINRVSGDRYAGSWPAEQFQKQYPPPDNILHYLAQIHKLLYL